LLGAFAGKHGASFAQAAVQATIIITNTSGPHRIRRWAMSFKQALGVGAATTVVLVATWLIYIARTDGLGAALTRAGMMGGIYPAIVMAAWALDVGSSKDEEGSSPVERC